MNKRLVLHLIFAFPLLVGISLLISAFVGLLMSDPIRDILSLSLCGTVIMLLSLTGLILTRPRNEQERKCGFREAFAIVAAGWIAAPLAGAAAFIVTGGFPVCDAIFESTSGFSTTGATIIEPGMSLYGGRTLPNGIESLCSGLLFFRSFSHWLGGMGIVVLTIAILPLFNISGQGLFNAESTGLKSTDSKIAPRIASSAKILWCVYVILTGLETVLLWLGGMTFFDAVCHSFSTIATGGFSNKTASIGAYHSAYIETVVAVFMFLAGCNFMLHIRFAQSRRLLAYTRDEEFRFYAILAAVASCVVALNLFLANAPPAEAFRAAVFHVLSILTTTGFATENYAVWPLPCCAILFILMFTGSCGGSTAGGMKCCRVVLVAKHSFSELRRCIFPHLVPDIRLNGERIETPVIQKAAGFLALYFSLSLLFALFAALLSPNMDLLTALSASLACISNIGPGFGMVGPAETCAWMMPAAKLLLSFEMILGRLELFTVLVLFLPSFWKK